MKTTDFELVCPYPGLRSFTEEESLYFKGRDQQIEQISDLLEQNKFLMLTGASGEGKSSLIYAGLIPNARAGFFKAHYTNWLVADFRPERNPVGNMAQAIAQALHLENETVATELKRGFSSLIDLYVNSEFYIDEQDAAWKSLPETEQKSKKRNAANLLIIIDQFEEFFTNPENFLNEAPSQSAQIVVNLALETARIALKRNLPVYVVCTMRSDFIGQCVAFRGLPEYIGFSQFFVPRLKRKDFKQVIEEPAILSGNRISQRLIERLVYDIAEGVDQLPVLQHALSQIWLAANRGNEEMDLIHYAMVGGMPASDLPDEDQSTFQKWYNRQPAFKKEFYTETGLNKIIEFHANTLYEGAWERYMALHPEKPIEMKDARRIIAMVFACLTKIDNSRAVRNRMSLQEITTIINDPELPMNVVGEVLSTYREEANSFIRPYKTDDSATHTLTADSVLDITHEALIRNWDKLNQWANTEYDFYTTWLDFRKQLNRWIENGKSSDYLLPIGPLTFFENWYEQCKPNAGWIARYADLHEDSQVKLEEAKKLLVHAKEFLKKSARRVIVTRTFMKYGTQRVAIFTAIVLMLVLSGFYWNDAENKQNVRVLERVISQANMRLLSEEVSDAEKANYLIIHERYEPGTLIPYLKNLENPKNRISIGIDTYLTMLRFDIHFRSPVKTQLIELLEKDLVEFSKTSTEYAFLVRQLNRYLVRLVFDNYYNPQSDFEARVTVLTSLLYNSVMKFYSDKSLFIPAIATELNMAVHLWLTLGQQPSQDKISSMLHAISVFEESGKDMFQVYYAKGTFEPDGNRTLDYSGGYHTLASLYAAAGNGEKVIACFDNLKVLPEYFTGRLFNNYNNIIGFMYQYGHKEKVPGVFQWIATQFPENTPSGILRNMVNRSGYLNRLYFMNITRQSRSHRGYLHMNLYMASRENFHLITDEYEKALMALPDVAERNYNLAIQYKRLAMFEHKYAFDRGISADTAALTSLLNRAWKHFELVPAEYLEGEVRPPLPYWGDGIRHPVMTRRNLFLYPDYMEGWFVQTFHTDLFYNYMRSRGLLEKHIQNEADLKNIHFWLAKAYEWDTQRGGVMYANFYPLSDEVLASVAQLLTEKGSEANLPYLILANRSFARSDTATAMLYYKKINVPLLSRSSNRFDYIEKTFFLNQVKDLMRNLAGYGKTDEAVKVMDTYTANHEKAIGSLFIAERLYANGRNPQAFVWLDSALTKMRNDDFTTLRFELDYRFKLVTLLGQIGGEGLNGISRSVVRDFFEFDKFEGLISQLRGIASEGNYYEAVRVMPSTFTETQELQGYYYLLLEACKAREKANGKTASEWGGMDEFFGWNQEYIFYVPF